MRHLYKCHGCGKYTMKETCTCGSGTIVAKHVKYTPADRLAPYRRKAKADEYRERGFI